MIIRIDDFPTGVRPLLKMSELTQILDAFQLAGITIHLAVVPKLIENINCPKHTNIIAIQHGYNHRYAEMSKKLVDAGDPFNKKTIGSFDEFTDEKPDRIATRLKEGWSIIRRKFKTTKFWYVPVCNLINKPLSEALSMVKYDKILSEQGVGVIKSDHYGRMYEIDYSKNPEVITLHITWEYDIIREKGLEFWLQSLSKLEKYYKSKLPKEHEDTERSRSVEGSLNESRSILGGIRMMDHYHILFKFPTRQRNEKFFKTLNIYYSMITGSNFSFHINLDTDDKWMNNKITQIKLARYKNLTYSYNDNKTKVEACNAEMPQSPWDICILVSDDMIPVVKGFDDSIRSQMEKHFPDTDGILFFNDGNQKLDVNTFIIIGRKYYERFYYLYHPDYKTLRCDAEFTETGFNLKKQVYFPSVIVEHHHPAFNKGKTDILYQRNNNNKLVQDDTAMFEQRRNYGFPVCSINDFESYIPKTAWFYWNSETPLPYLRYLTLLTFRIQHPDWGMVLYISGANIKKQWTGYETQDFVSKDTVNYLDEVYQLNCHIRKFDSYNLNPNYISDIFRWKILSQFGGWYFDMDQIFTGNFDKYRNYDIVYGCTKYRYSGVLGASRKSHIPSGMNTEIIEKLKRPLKNYCELGNWLFSKKIGNYQRGEKIFCTANNTFYPITDSFNAKLLYNGSYKINPMQSDAVHWFGGHPDSQAFNKIYTPKFARKSTDSISTYLRTLKII